MTNQAVVDAIDAAVQKTAKKYEALKAKMEREYQKMMKKAIKAELLAGQGKLAAAAEVLDDAMMLSYLSMDDLNIALNMSDASYRALADAQDEAIHGKREVCPTCGSLARVK